MSIAITPNGQTAYVANDGSNTVTPITISTNTAGSAITVGSDPWGIAITPNGQTAYVANDNSNTVTPITSPPTRPAAPSLSAPIPPRSPSPRTRPRPPRSPSPRLAGGADQLQRLGLGSAIWDHHQLRLDLRRHQHRQHLVTDDDAHLYHCRTFTATLTVTDTAGTSTTQVFTGQTVSNNGGPSASTSQTSLFLRP